MSVFGARSPRRLLTWLLIAQQLFVGTGVALPCYAEAKSSKERFPCENCRCGCHSAEQCWKACCCYTNAEKVAWARENGVAVPDYVVTAAKQEDAAAAKPKCPHCDQHVGRQTKACSTPARVGADCRRAGNTTHREPGICWLDVERCHGLTSYMQMAGPTWPGDPSLELRRVLPSLGRIVPQPFPAYLFTPADPPTPPPKLS
ncbi:MAG: hypothetical protein ACLQNE_02035 [Thermoguttaceae bacterium]